MTKMKVLLINAPYIDFYGPIKLAAGRYFSLGLGYIASSLRQNGFEVLLYEPDAQRLSYDALGKIFSKEKPDAIGISSATPNFYNAVKLARLAKKNCSCKVVLGGTHVSAIPEFIMEQHHGDIDYLVVGEGEDTMVELMQCLGSGQLPLKVRGICFWNDGHVVRTEPRQPIADIDSLQYPARDLIKQNLFKPNMHNIRHRKCFTILTSRGCPFNCSFCASYLTMGKRYRAHSAEYALNEMEYLKEQYGARQLIINDDTFTFDRRRLVEICEGMIRRRLNLQWFCFSNISTVDKDILTLMKKAGCYNIGFGIESASPRILNMLNKNISRQKCEEVISSANALGMKTQVFFIFGKEGETVQEAEDTIKLAMRLKPTLAFFNMLVPYPGTRDFDYFFHGIPLDTIRWEDFVAIGKRSVFSCSNAGRIDLENILYTANRKFYLRPAQLFHLLFKIKTLYEFESYLKGSLGLVLQMLAWRSR